MRTHRKLAVATVTALSLTGGLTAVTAGTAAAATPAGYADDFDGDGYRDYATGGNGKVTVVYGTRTGPGPKTVRFTQDSPHIPGEAGEAGGYADRFGDQLANADLNRDGYADLVVGDRSEQVGTTAGAGAVTVLWGSRAGLGAKATRLPVPAGAGLGLGAALASGDFDGDGRADLAVADGGSVYIYRGGFSPSGTTGRVTRNTPPGTLEPAALVAGKVDKDRATDLFVLGQGQESGGKPTQVYWYLHGGSAVTSGRFITHNQFLPSSHPAGVIADFDRNGYGDLAFGDIRYNKDSGSVVVIPGKAGGFGYAYMVTQSSPGVVTAASKGDGFGYSLSAGDTNRDGYPDLAVGVPGEDVGSVRDAGGVHILRGSRTGLVGTPGRAGVSQWFSRAGTGVPGNATQDERLGLFVRLRDFDRDGDADLLVSGDLNRRSVLLRATASGITTSRASETGLDPDFPQ
ncbi:FG-GAP and VCBS repeat-containing protein [Streptomyces sp. NPDC088810]|uniref:FG-GAP and VCBS repeat-containing protein n=1 Tax=Streptomyces sp. NPDC088810 TaxID=3365904 RepID=UPI0037FF81BF